MTLYKKRGLQRLVAAAVFSVAVATATAQTVTAKIVTAANAFLSALDQKQRQSVMYAFDDEKQRARWSNFPTGFVPRGGINLRGMTPMQRTAAMNLLAVTLSERGYEKVQQIMEGDEVNKLEEARGTIIDESIANTQVLCRLLDCVGCLKDGEWRRERDSNPR